ncbi:hypothetical protein GCM10009127_04910 [Alteraurantiacibacter aestuarii]|nr:DUF1932 domain-containing protein [Alteraurantiacibacter aestuarii]
MIGFGEAGSAFAAPGGWNGRASGWDIVPDRCAAMAQYGVTAGSNAAQALADADIILSLVTADSAVNAASDYAPLMKAGALWCDMNSVSPGSKLMAAQAVTAAGGRYVDVAVMAPVEKGRDVPLLISGPDAEVARAMLATLGFARARIVGDEVGRASSIKMIRSIMVKGMEALTYECAAAAEKAGVMDEVMSSLDASEKDWDWMTRTAYNRERMETHGLRRAAEMEEVARTLRELGVEPVMSEGTVTLQRRAAKPKARRNKAA